MSTSFANSQVSHGTSVADQIAPNGYNAFTAVTPRSTKTFTLTEPKKSGPKTVNHRVIAALRTDEERAHIRMSAAARRVNPESHWAAPSGMALHCKEIRQELAKTKPDQVCA